MKTFVTALAAFAAVEAIHFKQDPPKEEPTPGQPAPLAKGDDEENECPASCEPLKKPVMQCAVGCKDDDDKHQCVHNCMLNEKKVPQAEFDKCWNPCKAGLDELMKEHAGEFLQAEPEDDNATVEPHNNATVAPHNNDNATVAPHNNDDATVAPHKDGEAAVPLPTNATAVVE